MINININKVVIFYFSGTGNTWWVSEKMAQLFRDSGVKSAVYSIEALKPGEADELINSADLAGFGYPIYGSDLPLLIMDFLKRLAPVNGKRAFVFCTQWMYSGDGARTGSEFLTNKGFTVPWGEHFFMPNNVCITAFAMLPYTNDKKRINRRLDKTGQRIGCFVQKIVTGQRCLTGFNPFAVFLGNIQRVPFRKTLHKLRNLVDIDHNKCINCGDCVQFCPVGNISYNQAGVIKTSNKCIICLRCYNFCPVSAVTFLNLPHGNRKTPYRGPVENFHPSVLSQSNK